MITDNVRSCEHCQSPIAASQRWVREKIYDPQSTNQDPAYRHFHAEPFGGHELSCWEKHQMERDMARIAVIRENADRVQVMGLVA